MTYTCDNPDCKKKMSIPSYFLYLKRKGLATVTGHACSRNCKNIVQDIIYKAKQGHERRIEVERKAYLERQGAKADQPEKSNEEKEPGALQELRKRIG